MFLRVYQIYYQAEQLPNLIYIPHLNKECTVFFENSPIRMMVENQAHIGTEYFGVVSWKLKHKLGYEMKQQWRGMANIANHSTNEFTPESFAFELKRHAPDAMSFQRHTPHDPITYANQFHPMFSHYFQFIMHRIGYEWTPTRFENVFYCNYFVAKSELYERYVKEMLIPAMDVMKDMPELMENSNYPHPLPENLKQAFGVNHYTYHAFLCERMFSYFAHLHQLKCVHY
jgi:hypothetical protein